MAIVKLIEKMLAFGSDRSNLRAKVFGGGVVLNVTDSGRSMTDGINATLSQASPQ